MDRETGDLSIKTNRRSVKAQSQIWYFPRGICDKEEEMYGQQERNAQL